MANKILAQSPKELLIKYNSLKVPWILLVLHRGYNSIPTYIGYYDLESWRFPGPHPSMSGSVMLSLKLLTYDDRRKHKCEYRLANSTTTTRKVGAVQLLTAKGLHFTLFSLANVSRFPARLSSNQALMQGA